LIENLYDEFGPSPELPECDMMAYWLFCGSPWQDQLGYDAARQQHYAELKALGLSPEFRRSRPQTKTRVSAFVIELLFRLDSLASWIEAQESWIFWRRFRNNPAAWDRYDAGARQQTVHASVIARLPTVFDGISDRFIAEVIGDFRRWTKPQWVKILKMAARIAERSERPITELDAWVWWRYPIFSRYHWSAAEVCLAAREKFGDIDLSNEAAFQAAWVRRGLRFTGRRTQRKHPPLWDFVVNEQVPRKVPLKIPMLTWIPYENSPSQP
jgi:hypothetical protein